MEIADLRNMLTASLSRLYGTEAVGKLVEFWQGELRVLLYLYQHGDSKVNPSVLSRALDVSRARITAALTALRNKRYITMEMCVEDRRRMGVMLTPDGKGYIELKQRDVEKRFDGLLSGLGVDNALEFIRLMDLAVRAVKGQAMDGVATNGGTV